MLDNFNILHQNLNDKVSYQDFFHALGYKDNDLIFLRTFYDPDKEQGTPRNSQVTVSNFDSIIPTLKERNAEKYGVYFVVNGGGNDDTSVKRHGYARACFIDGDELSIEAQLKFLMTFKLEPSIIIRTRKSLHAYWLTPDGDLKYFRELQERLIQYFGSDPVIKNESRVMRLYGFNHCKADPVPVTLIKFDPDITYTQRQLHEALPYLEKKPKSDSVNITAARDPIPYGQRHNYVINRISFYMRTIGDNTTDEIILSAVCTDFLQNCSQDPPVNMDSFRAKYLKTIQKYRATKREAAADPGTYSKAATLWHKKHPGQEIDDSNDTWDEILADYIEYKATHEDENAIETIKTDDTPGDPSEEVQEDPTPADPMESFLSTICTERYKPIPTGFTDVDNVLNGGLIRQQIIFLTAAPGMGKTTLAQQIAENMARNGASVLYFNLEMSREQMLARSLARVGADGLNSLQILQAYKLTEEQRDKIREAANIYADRIGDRLIYNPTYRDENGKIKEPGANLDNIIKAMRQAGNKAKKEERPAPIVVVDYLHLLSGNSNEDVTAIIKRATEELKQYATDYNSIVILISASNRSANKSGRASMDSGRDTSNIEYSGDVMLTLNYKSSDRADGESAEEIADKIKECREAGKPIPDEYTLYSLRIVKSRFTEAYTHAVLRFDGAHSRFTQVAKSGSVKPLADYKKREAVPSGTNEARATVKKKQDARERKRQDYIDAYERLKGRIGGVTLSALADELGVSKASVKSNIKDLLPGMFEIDGTTADSEDAYITRPEDEIKEAEALFNGTE